jgi:hypothetical protein
MIRCSAVAGLAVFTMLGALSCQPAQAQLGPQLYAASHFFGSTRTASLRSYGMGGGLAVVPDATSLNPAHAASNENYGATLRHARTRFDDGTRFDSTFLNTTIPLGRRDGLQIVVDVVRSPEKAAFVAGAPGFGGSTQIFRENSLGIFYGRRLSDKLSVGFGAAPILDTRHELRGANFGAGPGTIVIQSRALSSELKHLGGRIGLDYQFARWGRLGVIYDNFWEKATLFAPPQLAPLTSSTEDFHDVVLSGGVFLQPTKRLSLALERERASVSSNTFRLKGHNTYFGAEWQATKNLSLRAGSHDGSTTFGLGYTRGAFSLEYAHLGDLAGDETRPFFGGNRFDMLSASYQF